MIPQWLSDNLHSVAQSLRPLEIEFAFLGGCIVPLLLDDPDLTPIRPTNDVDVVILLVSRSAMAQIEGKLRRQGFVHDDRWGAPMCRWRLKTVTVDIMPDSQGALMGLNTRWFTEALRSARPYRLIEMDIPVISAPAFVATKFQAFADRGEGDLDHRDLEDIITVIDGRASFAAELEASNNSLQSYVRQELSGYLARPDFIDSLGGHLSADAASQSRLPKLLERLRLLSTGARLGA